MGKENSKKNQRPPEAVYRFGEFELNPGERRLIRNGEPVPLAPKAFDALLCLVRNAEHLIGKRELMDTLWPSTYVSEANLTNTIVSLRKVLGQDAIRTVSKHGYRFVADVELADAAFKRAFLIEPDLACAHQFYTPVEADMGEARRALARLLARIERNPGEPESFTGLVQVLRFCGLLQESAAAHKRATELDPTVVTSLPHTLFLNQDYAATIETYSGRAGYYLDAAAWAAWGDKSRAATLLRDRLGRMPLSELMKGLMDSLLALLEDRFDDAIHSMDAMKIHQEPEVLTYLARHYSYIGSAASAINMLKRAAESGFVCAPDTLRSDPWLSAVRRHPEFKSVLTEAQSLADQAHSMLQRHSAGMERL